jgi:hypothetical protein
MKTAEEIREEIAIAEGCASWANLIATEDLSIGEKVLEVDRCMKAYGRQCAEQALKDAADRATYIRIGKIVSINTYSITNTPIVTP